MDKTSVKARDNSGTSRARKIGPVGLETFTVGIPEFSSAARACTSAFTVSAAGLVALHFVVAEGASPVHAFMRITGRHKVRQNVHQERNITEAAVVCRRCPQGFYRGVFDVCAEHIATFTRSYHADEGKSLAIDWAKLHLSPGGLLTDWDPMCMRWRSR